MSASVPTTVRLYDLPDDILRALAAFVPPSGLITLARCSQRLAMVLRGQLTQRLDGLFVSVQLDSNFWWSGYESGAISDYNFEPLRLRALFGEACPCGYHFVEAFKGCDGPPRIHQLSRDPLFNYPLSRYIYRIHGPNVHALNRFEIWLQRRYDQLLSMHEEIKVKGAISGFAS
jgi:hypothetical protein